ncbi:dTMP kinase [Alistipes finegoldii]|jgi:dTMP kinase|uniref:dTMP kinase n=1 Tax=Alistipes finegoldii TaxID=214856 RepID=UPI001B547CAA|nr:thymidylate kinase [Alistipes finegoldii]MBP8044506.1 thymidylate kinase [Alistipes sp.]
MFIVLEGLDGAGKSTQIRMLRQLFADRGVESEYVHFPRFDSPVYGQLIARFLRGEFGGVQEVDPYLVALIFAGDRADAAPQIRQWLAEGKAVVLDRYVYSNVGFQCAKLPAGEERDRLADWIVNLEFGHNALPRPDLSLFLDVPFAFTERKLSEVREGDDRDYLQGGQDIHEASLQLQQDVRSVYLASAAKDPSLRVVDCSDASGAMESPEGIFAKIRAELIPILGADA